MAGSRALGALLASLTGRPGRGALSERRNAASRQVQSANEMAVAGKFEEAIAGFEAALALDPGNYLAQFGRAKALIELDDPDGPAALERVSRAFPTKFIPYKRRAELHLKAGRYLDALEVLAEARAHLPDEHRIAEIQLRILDRYARDAEAIRVQNGGWDGPAPVALRPPPLPSPFACSLRTEAALNDYLPFFRISVNALERQALRERSFRTRELLALTATDGLLGFEELIAALRDLPVATLGPALGGVLDLPGYRARALVALARVTASQELSPRDPEDARALYRFVRAVAPEAMRAIDWVQALLLPTDAAGIAGALRDLGASGLAESDPVDFALLLSNLMQAEAAAAGRPGFANPSLFALNALFRQSGIEGIRVQDPARPIASLATDPLDNVVTDGPLVTVVMTSFNADHSLDLAMQSVLGQSWRNLEVIVVDDCSEPASFAQVQQWEARDPRVRVLRNARNQGTYVAKNRGLAEARGEFVTCHDSDDWSHARKIQLQVESLVRAEAVAGISRWVRCTPDLRFEMFSGAGTLAYPNLSSLMYRRAPIAEKIGFYDAVRTGADSEFKRRIERVFDEKTLDTGPLPLSFGQVHSLSLTANSLGRGWFSPDRLAYRSAWNRWHDRLRETGASAYLPQEGDRARYAVPVKLLPDRAPASAPEVPHYDVVMISDFRMAGGNTVSAIEEIKAQARAGLRTAICQVGAFRKGFMHREFIDARMQDVISAGLADRIDIADRVDARLLTIRYPAVFQFAAGTTTGIRAERLTVVMNQPPSENDTRDRRYDLAQVAANITAIFGVPQLWTPIGPIARAAIADVARPALLSARDWFNVIDLDEWSGPRAGPLGPRPIIGRHSRDDYSKWPHRAADLLAAYPADGDIQMRVLGGAEAVGKILGRVPPAWHVLEFGAETPRNFLNGIDFFVYFHHPKRVEAFGRTIIEAMASGCVAVLPRSFEPLLKESAIYCGPGEVRETVLRLHGDPAAFAAQSRRAFDYVRAHFGYDAHLARLRAVWDTGAF